MKWHRITEKRPDIGQYVLIAHYYPKKGSPQIEMAVLWERGFYLESPNSSYRDPVEDPAFWCALPQPPKGLVAPPDSFFDINGHDVRLCYKDSQARWHKD